MTLKCKKLNCGEDYQFPRDLVSGLIAIARYHQEIIIFQGSKFIINMIIILLFFA